jgi:adenosylcobinamide kinase / adenosylcobinamide-phosphate guanylyltransferase
VEQHLNIDMKKASLLVPSLLVIGAARSGKSSFAQKLAETSGKQPVLIATAQPHDAEMAARIDRHKAERSAAWRVLEEPHALGAALQRAAAPAAVVVVDCLTLWLSNVLLAGGDCDAEGDLLAGQIGALGGSVIFVSNEVGAGIVPDNDLSRRFRDVQGRLNQKLAAACDSVILVAAGLPLMLKPASVPNLVV